MHPNRRRKLYVDRQVQRALLSRLVLYWLSCLTVVFGILAGIPLVMFWFAFGEPVSPLRVLHSTGTYYYPIVIASALVLPLFVWDCARVSNKFGGPVLRLRQTLRQLAEGQVVEPLKFRDDDFWHDVAEDFNRVITRVQDAVPAVAADSESQVKAEEVRCESKEETAMV